MNHQRADILAALRAILNDAENPLPNREADPLGYVIAQSNRTAAANEELSVEDKDLAYRIWVAGGFGGPITASSSSAADDDE